MLESNYTSNLIEAGCDEAGRGCLAGPVFAAAVILPKGYKHSSLNDSKQLSRSQRDKLRTVIECDALGFAISQVDAQTIDQINILNASFLGMEQAVNQLPVKPELLLIDGNRFRTTLTTPYHCIVKGDGKFLSIAAASILAKTYRDEFMEQVHEQFPMYRWNQNKGYPTAAHRQAITAYGITPFHRKSFRLEPQQKILF
ncbi:MAG: ribonuclease HII [Bacteroidales bacterium]|nr:ribonuclease HII [Bacteroidales bacterium]